MFLSAKPYRNFHIILITLFVLMELGAGKDPPKPVSIPFRVGEQFIYSAQFNIVPAGTAELKILGHDSVNSIPVYHVQFEARTKGLAERIYKIRDRIDTWIDRENLFTHRQEKKIREGRYRTRVASMIHYDQSIAITNDDTINVDTQLHDPYSLFYYLRSIPLETGEILDFTAFDNNVLTEFQIKIAGKETVLVPAGTFPCVVVEPFREGKTLFKNQGDMKIWFSDDLRRIPVQIHIKLKYGSMNLQLESFEL